MIFAPWLVRLLPEATGGRLPARSLFDAMLFDDISLAEVEARIGEGGEKCGRDCLCVAESLSVVSPVRQGEGRAAWLKNSRALARKDCPGRSNFHGFAMLHAGKCILATALFRRKCNPSTFVAVRRPN